MLKQIPNILTTGRFVLAVIFLIMILYAPAEYQTTKPPFPSFLDLAFILFVIAGLTDIIDGYIARRLNVTSRFGRLLDPLADKLLICGTFICFAVIRQPTFDIFNLNPLTSDIIRWVIAAIIVLRETVVTVLRHTAEAKGIEFGAVISGKLKMFSQSFAIGTVMVKWAHVSRSWGDWFTAVIFLMMLALTIISGIQSIHRASVKLFTFPKQPD